ncbi:IclR family transcriptional regulator [Paraburkholderia bannensis]|uniref:IclR family transcriptional regulator n=1 Tax=Paraburkholderia bannensis TaxID=765414 RepID=UPI002AB6AA5B|nr:IclR family transcriptional regulator [Paraburkholderia bannensis]
MATSSTRTSSRQTVQSAEIGAEILKALARLGPAASLSGLAEAAGMAPAKAHRYLQAMIASGLAAQERQSGRYTLGPEAIKIGMAAIAQIDVVGGISELLPDLRDETGHTCFLAVWGNQGATVVRTMESIGEVTILTRTGSKMPLLRSATGLMFAAWLSPRVRDAEALNEPAELQAQLHDPASPLNTRLETIRRSGISSVKGLMVPGIDAMAAPVFDARSEIVAVLTLIGTDNALDPSPEGVHGSKLAEIARIASARLGAPDVK